MAGQVCVLGGWYGVEDERLGARAKRAIFVVYGFVAHAFRRFVIESARVQSWLRYTFASAFAGLGAKLAFSEK